jgi:hypothetical protein
VAALAVAALGVAALGVAGLGVLELAPLGVPLAVAVGAAGPVPPGDKGGGVVGGGEAPLQADTDAVANRAKAAQPRTVRRKRRRP